MRKIQKSSIAKLLELYEEIEQRLLKDEDYKTLVALKKTIDAYESHKLEMGTTVQTTGTEHKAPPRRPSAKKARRLSHRQASVTVLEEMKKPLAIDDLFSRLQKLGVRSTSAHPKSSLSSMLSSDRGFELVRYEGKRCWWLAGRPVPSQEGPEG